MTPNAVVRGDLITGQGVSPAWARLALGSSGDVLVAGAKNDFTSGFMQRSLQDRLVFTFHFLIIYILFN